LKKGVLKLKEKFLNDKNVGGGKENGF